MRRVWTLLCLVVPVSCGPLDVSPHLVDAQDEAALQGACTIVQATIVDFGKVIYRGPVDLDGEVARIWRGDRLPFRHDGAVFRNREGRLPRAAVGYYREYVHPTQGLRGPGPQRIVRGRADELHYTPDHYASFLRMPTDCVMPPS